MAVLPVSLAPIPDVRYSNGIGLRADETDTPAANAQPHIAVRAVPFFHVSLTCPR